MKPSTPKQRYLISVVARFEWREYQCQYILIHFHEMHLVIKFKRTYYSCQWKRRSFPGTKRNSIWRPLITCASVRWRARRNTLPCIRLIGTGDMLDCSLRFYALMANQSSTVPLDLLLCDWMKSAGLHDGRNGDPLPLGLADLGGSQHFSSTTPVFLAPSCSAPIAS